MPTKPDNEQDQMPFRFSRKILPQSLEFSAFVIAVFVLQANNLVRVLGDPATFLLSLASQSVAAEYK